MIAAGSGGVNCRPLPTALHRNELFGGAVELVVAIGEVVALLVQGTIQETC